eukprot:scaffold103786_cov27-Prasinocladus_malaysianus.AAC.3
MGRKTNSLECLKLHLESLAVVVELVPHVDDDETPSVIWPPIECQKVGATRHPSLGYGIPVAHGLIPAGIGSTTLPATSKLMSWPVVRSSIAIFVVEARQRATIHN